MTIIKLDYIFAHLLLYFVLCEVQLKISFSIYFLGHFCWIKVACVVNLKLVFTD